MIQPQNEAQPPLEIFYCYARKDQALRDELNIHLSGLHRSKLITSWYDGMIVPGKDWEQEIKAHLDTASIFLLLISSDFINSDYCCSNEMNRAIERHNKHEARVIPILLRSCDWKDTPFSTIQMLPTGAISVDTWKNRDEAYADIARGIRHAVEEELKALKQQQGQDREQSLEPGILFTISSTSENSEQLRNEVRRNSDYSDTDSYTKPPNLSPPTPLPTQSESSATERVRFISRRKLLLGGAGLGLAATAGGIWFFTFQSSHAAIYTYKGHSSSVNGIFWSPNSKRIASASSDSTVQVWNATDGSSPLIYTGHSNIVYGVAWSPGATRIASASSDSTVQVWNATDGSFPLIYTGHSNSATSAAWSPDGKRVVSGSYDRTVQVWNAFNGSSLFTYQGHSNFVAAVAWSPDGRHIASASYDGTVKVWNAANGSSTFTYRGHSSGVSAIAWSPDSKRIASASYDHTIQIWNSVDGSSPFTYTGHSNKTTSVAWSPDGTRVASASYDHTVQVWNAADGSSPFIYEGHSDIVGAVAWSPDGTRIASASYDHTVRIWNVSWLWNTFHVPSI